MATDFPAVLRSVRDRLVEYEVVSRPELVQFIARDGSGRSGSLPHLTGDRDVLLRVKGMRSPLDIVQSAGRLARMYRTIEVILRTRDARDKPGSDEAWLAREDQHLDFEHEVLDALQMFHPTMPRVDDVPGIEIIGEPMRFLTSTDPDHRLEAAGREQGWGSSVMLFEVMYEPDIDQTWQ